MTNTSQIKLVFFDLSKTVIKESAFNSGPAFIGRGPIYQKVWKQFRAGKLSQKDFATAVLREWKGIPLSLLPEISKTLTPSEGIENLLKILKDKDIKTVLVSVAPRQIVEIIGEKLGFDFIVGIECKIKNDRFTGRAKELINKGKVVKEIARQARIPLKNCMAIGDSPSEIPMFKLVGISFAYRAPKAVQNTATHSITNFSELISVFEGLRKEDI